MAGYGNGAGNGVMMNRPHQYVNNNVPNNNNNGVMNPGNMVRAQRPPNVTVGPDGMNAWRQNQMSMQQVQQQPQQTQQQMVRFQQQQQQQQQVGNVRMQSYMHQQQQTTYMQQHGNNQTNMQQVCIKLLKNQFF